MPVKTEVQRNKQPTQLLISPHTKMSGQELSIVRQESVAEVWRTLITAQMPAMQRSHAGALEQLRDALTSMNIVTDEQRGAALQAMVDQKIRFGDLFLADGSPRTVFPGRLPA